MGHVHALQGPRPVAVELGHGLRAAVLGLREADLREAGLRERPADHQISPELALVCPELRAEALARLPDRDPDGFVPAPVPAEPEPAPVTALPSRPAVGRLALAAGAYAAVEAARTAAFGAGFTAGLVGLMTAAELLRG